ncbi:hypothetical protein COBT_003903, partial [Conglomerata obtusa]
MQTITIPKVTSLNVSSNITLSSFTGQSYTFDYELNPICRLEYTEPILCSLYTQQTISSSPTGRIYYDERIISTNCGGIEKLNMFGNVVIVGGWNQKIAVVSEHR